jgi:hypothetical protein
VLNRHWKVRGPVCIGKCAEAAAYGRALPECDGIYLAEQTQGGRKKHARVLEQRATSRELDRDFLTLENNLGCRASHALATTVSEKDYVDEHEIDRDAKLLALIAQSAPMMSSQQRRAFLAEFREHAETFEDDNPDLFAAKVVEDVTRRVRLRRA